MADGNLGVLSMSITGKDDISPVLKKIESELEKLQKTGSGIELTANYKELTKGINDLSKEYIRLSKNFSAFDNLGLDTKPILAQLNQVKDSLERLYDIPKRHKDWYSDSFSIKSNSGVDKTLSEYVNGIAGISVASAKSANAVASDAVKMEDAYNKAVLNIDNNVRKLEAQKTKLEAAKSFKGQNLTDIAEIQNNIKAIDREITSWKELAKNKELALNSSYVTMQRNASDATIANAKAAYDSAKAHDKLAKSREKAAQAAAKEAEKSTNSLGSARALLSKYNGYIENMKSELTRQKDTGFVSSETTEKIREQIQELEILQKLLKEISNDKARSLSKTEMSSAGSMYAVAMNNAGLTKAQAQREINAGTAKERADERQTVKEQEREQRQLAKEYEASHQRIQSTIENTRKKIELLKIEASRKESMGIDATPIRNVISNLETLKRTLESVQNTDMRRSESMDYLNKYRKLANDGDIAVKSLNSVSTASRNADNALAHNATIAHDLVQQYNRLSNATKEASNTFNNFKDLLYQFAPVYGMQQLVMSVIETGGEIEKQHIALQSILGDLQDANSLFGELKGLALASPFTFGDLTKDVKQLAAYNVETDELYDTTKRLADISAGLGVSFERIALAYGQTKARSWLDAKELRQFSYAGVPLLQRLAEMYSQNQGKTVSTSAVRKMIQNRQVGFEDVQKVLWNMTDEGGQFYNMQLVLSETLLGRYNKLKDAWEIMLSGFAKGDSIVGGTMKHIIDLITNVVLAMNGLAPVVASFFTGFGLKKLGLVGNSSRNSVIGNNILSSKQSAANKYLEWEEEQKLKGVEFTRTQYAHDFLATSKQITSEDLKQLATVGSLTKQDLRRLYISGQITREQYKQTSTLMGWSASMSRFTGRFSILFSTLGNGIKGIASGILGFFGGPIGVAITGATAAASYFWQKSEDMKNRVKQTAEEAQDRYKQLHDFVSQNPVDFTLNTKDMQDRVRAQMEELKDKAGQIFGVLTTDMNGGDDSANMMGLSGRMKRYGTLLNELEKSESLASDLRNVFEKAYDAADPVIGKSAISFASDYSKALSDVNNVMSGIIRNNDWKSVKELYDYASTSTNGGLNKLANDIANAKREGKGLVEILTLIKDNSYSGGIGIDDENSVWNNFGEKIRDLKYNEREFAVPVRRMMNDVKKEFELQGIDVTSDIGMMLYNNLMQSFFSSHEMSKEDQQVFSLTADACMGFEVLPTAVNEIAEIAMNNLDETVKAEIGNGQILGEASRKEMEKAMQSAYDQWYMTLPTWIQNMQNDLDKHKLFLSVQAQMTGTEAMTALQEWGRDKTAQVFGTTEKDYNIITRALTDSRGSKAYARVNKLLSSGSLTEAQNQNDSDIKKAKDELNRLKSRNARQDLIQEQENALALYEDAAKVIGHAPDKTKNNNKKTGNSRDTELEDLEKRAKVIERLIALYKELRKLYGSDIAAERVNKEAEKVGIFGYDFSDPVAAREKLTKEFLDLYNKKKTDRRKSAWQNYDVKTEDEQRQKEKDSVEALTKAYGELNDVVNEQISLRDSFAAKHGKNTATILANMIPQWNSQGRVKITSDKNYVDYLKKSLQNEIASSRHSEISVDEALDLSDDKINEYFGEDSKAAKAIYQLRKASVDAAKDASNAIASQLDLLDSTPDKLEKIEYEYQSIVDRINANAKKNTDGTYSYTDIEKRALELAKANKEYKEFMLLPEQVSFFNNIYGKTVEQAENIGILIKEQLDKRMQEGTISAEEYCNEIKKIQDQLNKIKTRKNGITGFLTSGLNGLQSVIQGKAESELFSKTQNVESTAKTLRDAQEAYKKSIGTANEASLKAAMEEAKLANDAAVSEQAGAVAGVQAAGEMASTVGIIDMIVNGINNMVQGIQKTIEEIDELEESYGKDTSKKSFGKQAWATFANSSQSAADGWNSLKNGDLGGMISGVVGSWTKIFVGINQYIDSIFEDTIADIEDELNDLENVVDRVNSKFGDNINTASSVKKITGMYAQLTKQMEGLGSSLSDATKSSYGLFMDGGRSFIEKLTNDIPTLQEEIADLAEKTGKDYNFWDGYKESSMSSLAGYAVGGIIGGFATGAVGLVSSITKLFNQAKNERKLQDYQGELYATVEALDTLAKAGITADKALNMDSISTYSTGQYEALVQQRYDLEKQLAAEEASKSTDDDKVKDYQSQIADLNDEIDDFAKNLEAEFYDLDLDSWADNLSDALCEAFANGEDAAEAFADTTNEMIRGVVKNLIQQKVLEPWIEELSNKIFGYTDENGNSVAGMWDSTDVNGSTEKILQYLHGEAKTAGEEKVAQAKALWTAYNDTFGGDLTESDSSSMSSSMQGVTEDTADLLDSYINAIRADVSMNRGYLEVIADNSNALVSLMGGTPGGTSSTNDQMVLYASAINTAMMANATTLQSLVDTQIPTMTNYLATQVASLKTIEANSTRSADGVEELVSMISSAVKGINPLNVKVN